MHDAPTVHGLQDPLSQTSFVPHVVPLATSVPVSVQVNAVHETVPTWQGLVGVHASSHAVQEPLSQASLAPQDVPLAI